MNTLPKSMQTDSKTTEKTGNNLSMPFSDSFSSKQLVSFTRSMAVLIKARLPLIRALETLQEQISNKEMKAVLADIKDRIEQGGSLAESLKQYPDVFSISYVHLVNVGEETGTLSSMLERIAELLEKKQRLQQKVRSAMMYPGLVFTVSVGTFFFLLTVVVPSFSQLYAGFETGMPYMTSVVLKISNFFTANIGLLGLSAAAVIFAGWMAYNSERGKHLWDRIVLKIPILGSLLLKNVTANYTQTLGTLLKNGVSLVESLTLVEQTQTNIVFVKATQKFKEAVKKGESLASVVKSSSVFPAMVEEMVAVGEETAELDELLLHISESYSREVDIKVEGLTSVLEPILIVFLGILVGSIIIALYLPIFDLMNVVQ